VQPTKRRQPTGEVCENRAMNRWADRTEAIAGSRSAFSIDYVLLIISLRTYELRTTN